MIQGVLRTTLLPVFCPRNDAGLFVEKSGENVKMRLLISSIVPSHSLSKICTTPAQTGTIP